MKKRYSKYTTIKNLAKYTNVCYYEFLFNKDLKIRLKQKIKEGKIEAHCFGKRLKYD